MGFREVGRADRETGSHWALPSLSVFCTVYIVDEYFCEFSTCFYIECLFCRFRQIFYYRLKTPSAIHLYVLRESCITYICLVALSRSALAEIILAEDMIKAMIATNPTANHERLVTNQLTDFQVLTAIATWQRRSVLKAVVVFIVSI